MKEVNLPDILWDVVTMDTSIIEAFKFLVRVPWVSAGFPRAATPPVNLYSSAMPKKRLAMRQRLSRFL
jgi:hypothetical protein